MDITSKASIILTAALTADDVKGMLLSGVQAAAIPNGNGMIMVSGAITLAADQSAVIKLVYEKSDMDTAAQDAALPEQQQADAGGPASPTPATPPAPAPAPVQPAAPAVNIAVPPAPTATA